VTSPSAAAVVCDGRCRGRSVPADDLDRRPVLHSLTAELRRDVLEVRPLNPHEQLRDSHVLCAVEDDRAFDHVSELTDIPVGNPVISFLFRLQYADPQELQQVLMAYLQGSSGTINILALPKSSSLLVTQNADIIRQLASVIEQIDVAPAEVVSEFIKLERADATKVVDMLKEIFERDSQQTSQPGIRSVKVPPAVPQPMPVGEGNVLGGLSEEAVIVGRIKLTADVRTNRIHVVTRPINMPFIRRLVREFDANVEFGKPVTRPLRYISAGEVLPVLVQALTEPGAEAGAHPPGQADRDTLCLQGAL